MARIFLCTLVATSSIALALDRNAVVGETEELVDESVVIQEVDQPDNEVPTVEETIAAFSLQPPDESSPFFADRELARMERRQSAQRDLGGATGPNDTAIYPSTRSTNSASATFTRFFTEMFSSIRFGKKDAADGPATIKVEPNPVSLSDRREVDVTFVVTNEGKRIQRIDYPSTQRVEITAVDQNGQQVERWSDDRFFEPEDGIVFINPGERIQYWEKVPTRDMKPGESYEIRAEVASDPELSATELITPEP